MAMSLLGVPGLSCEISNTFDAEFVPSSLILTTLEKSDILLYTIYMDKYSFRAKINAYTFVFFVFLYFVQNLIH